MIPELFDYMEDMYTSSATYWNADPAVVKANIPKHRIGFLPDTITCTVTEDRNGPYELLLTYPAKGRMYGEIYTDRCIMASANQVDGPQLFRIYRCVKTLRGILTVYARHISYDLSGIDIVPIGLFPQSRTPAGWMTRIFQNTFFTATSDITAVNDLHLAGLMSCRAMLAGEEGSILDTFGGEYHFDNFGVALLKSRGSDKGVVIEYGKNLTELSTDENSDCNYTAIRGCARYSLTTGEERVAVGSTISTGLPVHGHEWTKIIDVTDALGLEAGNTPTTAAIDAAAWQWALDNMTDPYDDGSGGTLIAPFPEVSVSCLNEPSKYATLGLGDIVTVRHLRMGINIQQKVISVEWDTLMDRYNQITLGSPAGSLVDTVNDIDEAVATLQKERPRFTSGSNSVDLSGGVLTLYNGTYTTKLTAGIGRRVHDNGVEQSLSSGTTMQNLASFELTKGTWVVSITARFASNATGRRAVNMSDTSGGSAINAFWGDGSAAVSGAYTYLRMASTVRVTDATHTYYVNGYQNSGSALGVTAAYDAVRIY